MSVVRTTSGDIEGVTDQEVDVFWGIPFAAPPVGDLRFHGPQLPESWSGVRVADRPGPASLQSEHRLPGFSAEGPLEEDCLYLNVFTPAPDKKARPVMVWIHGGAFTHGSGADALYDGGNLVTRGDVVLVCINYRLAALGFLHLKNRLGEHGLANNIGLLDCIAALEWVRSNASAFGGDPDNVTIFGESAGAAAVGCLLAMPGARGLFHRAILQSGQGRGLSEKISSGLVDRVLKEMDLSPEDAPALLSLPAERILAAGMRAAAGPFRQGPAIDDETMPEQPLKAVAAGAAETVDLLIGNNRDENKLFMIGPERRLEVDKRTLLNTIRPVLPGLDDDALATIVEVYKASRELKGLPSSNLDVGDAITGDVQFRVGGVALAEAQAARGGNAFMYLFTHESPARGGSLGSCHALEIPFVFGNTHQPAQAKFAGSGEAVEKLSHDMMDAWINFARTGNPAHEGIGDWPKYDPARRATMIFGPGTGLQDDPFAEERDVLSQ
jgi:para-nitrobenzyl esterase